MDTEAFDCAFVGGVLVTPMIRVVGDRFGALSTVSGTILITILGFSMMLSILIKGAVFFVVLIAGVGLAGF